jgi:uncharacterized protein with ParB-like and HNH nuclease domain
MEPTKQELAEILTANAKISVPIYQRQYAWEEERVQAFWDDLIRVSKDKDATHYMGTMVKRPEPSLNGGVPHYMVIDGQQRMTVLMLLSSAIRDFVKKDRVFSDYIQGSEKVKMRMAADPHGVNLHLPRFVDETYLHFYSAKKLSHKFLPTELNKDREVFSNVVYAGKVDKRKRHHRHYNLFMECLKNSATEYRTLHPEVTDQNEAKVNFMHEVLDGLSRMHVVFIELEESDDPQQIFESINHKGEPLTVTDLIRNHLLTLANEGERKVLFKQIWEPLEDCLCQKRDQNEGVIRKSLFEGFFRAYVGMNGKVVPGKKLYAELRDLLQADLEGVDVSDTPAIVSRLKKFSEYATTYQALVWPGAGISPELTASVDKFSRLDFTTPMSLMMLFYGRSSADRPDDLLTARAFGVLENYYLRRALLGRTVKRMSEFFAHLCTLWLNELPQSSDFPAWLECKLITETKEDFSNLKPVADADLMSEIQRSRVYSLSRTATSFALCQIEISRSTASGTVTRLANLDVEHVLPQDHETYWMADLKEWHKALAEYPSEPALQERWINDKVDLLKDTIGNLTLTNFNRNLKNFSFLRKRDYKDDTTAEKGYKDTNIRIARDDFNGLDRWTFEMIEARSIALCKELIKIYPEFQRPIS